MKKTFSFLLYTFYALIVLGMIVLFVAPPIPGIGLLDVKIVKSGSMEPSIMTGAVVVIKEMPTYSIGDVITFTSENSEIPTTHRIVGTEKVDGVEYFISKGDANEERDTDPVFLKNIVGRVMVDVPYVGFILDFARQPIGFMLLIGVPALLIILDEFARILREVRRIRYIKFTKEMIMPLVIAPYQPPKISALTPVSPVVAVKAGLMDIKPIIKQPVTVAESRLVDKKAPVRVSHDIRPRFAFATATAIFMVIVAGQTSSNNLTMSYPNDIEASLDNSLIAQTLDFTVDPSNQNFTFLDGVIDGVSDVDVVVTPNVDVVSDMAYEVSAIQTNGNSALCNDILVTAESPVLHNGSLLSLVGTNVVFTSPWNLDFSLGKNGGYASGDTCEISLRIDGYIQSVGSMSGYVDTEYVVLNFTTLETEASVSTQEVNPSSFSPALIIDESGSTTMTIIEESADVQIVEGEVPNESTFTEVGE
jgi:signal peptidase I